MKIAIDAMGGDNCPWAEVAGVVSALKEIKNIPELILVGDEQAIRKEFKNQNYSVDSVKVIHAAERVLMDDSPGKVLKTKPNSSMIKAVTLCARGEADGVISAGNTGAFMASAIFGLGRLKGISRPAIGLLLPTLNPNGTPSLMLDAGANVDCKPKNLVEFAFMGVAYIKAVLGMKNPSVALLSVGEESTKGNETVIEAHSILQKSDLNFIGNIEGNDIIKGTADLIVCDGFIGNIILKFYESFPYLINKMSLLKKDDPNYGEFIKLFNRDNYGCGPLLGIKGVVSIAHGSTNPRGFVSAIVNTEKVIRNRVHENIENYIKESSINVN
ncbi:MAG: phosphate acyltransferase PlsX [bacterium]